MVDDGWFLWLPRSDLALLHTIGRLAWGDAAMTKASQEVVRARTGLPRSTFARSEVALRALGLIQLVVSRNSGRLVCGLVLPPPPRPKEPYRKTIRRLIAEFREDQWRANLVSTMRRVKRRMPRQKRKAAHHRIEDKSSSSRRSSKVPAGAAGGVPLRSDGQVLESLTVEDVQRVLGPVEVLYDGPALCPICAGLEGR